MLHPDRYSTTGVISKKKGVVIHDSESSDGSAQALIKALGSPGDRPLSGGRVFGAGYHAVTDGKGGYVQVATSGMGPFHAPPLNKTFWGLCLPGFAKQTAEEWQDEISNLHLDGAARFIVDKYIIDGFPLVHRSVLELQKGLGGLCSHKDVTDAWHQTDHYDPGPGFPWGVLLTKVTRLLAPPETITTLNEGDFPVLIKYNNDDNTAMRVDVGGGKYAATGVPSGDIPAMERQMGVKLENVSEVLWSDLFHKAIHDMGFVQNPDGSLSRVA